MSYVVVAHFRTVADGAEAFGALMGEHARRSRSEEPGCQVFELCQDEADPRLFLLYEVYDDEVAYQAHRADPRHPAILKAVEPLLEKTGESLFHSRQVLRRISP
jgi:quinol monooxygenase YgiN